MERGEIRFHQERRKHGGENRVANASEKILSKKEKMLLGENRVGSRVLEGLCWLLLPGARGGAAPEWATVRNAQPQGHCTLHTA